MQTATDAVTFAEPVTVWRRGERRVTAAPDAAGRVRVVGWAGERPAFRVRLSGTGHGAADRGELAVAVRAARRATRG